MDFIFNKKKKITNKHKYYIILQMNDEKKINFKRIQINYNVINKSKSFKFLNEKKEKEN